MGVNIYTFGPGTMCKRANDERASFVEIMIADFEMDVEDPDLDGRPNAAKKKTRHRDQSEIIEKKELIYRKGERGNLWFVKARSNKARITGRL